MEYEAKRIMAVLAALETIKNYCSDRECVFCILNKRCNIKKGWSSAPPYDWNTEYEEKKLFEIMKENENK
jgi:hypothetical protein